MHAEIKHFQDIEASKQPFKLSLASRVIQRLLRHDGVAASVAASASVGAVMGGAMLQTLSDTCETLRDDFPVAQS
jgi:hypothetical protein